MNKIIATTCAVVVGGVAYFVSADISDRREIAAEEASQAAMVKAARQAVAVQKCARHVQNWEAGRHDLVEAVYGSQAESMMSTCRLMVELDRVSTD